MKITFIPRRLAHYAIILYQLSFSMLIGRSCRHWPSCSHYVDEAMQKHGLWAGGWMGVARLCRCHPWGTEGIDLVPQQKPHLARWYKPWTYGLWRNCSH